MKNKTTLAIRASALLLSGLAVSSLADSPPDRLFIQQATPHSVVIKWRGGDGNRVCYATKPDHLNKQNWPHCVAGVLTAAGHLEARLTGLAPDKHYFYTVGAHISPEQVFRTPPNSNKPPGDGNTHILAVGDSGTQTEEGHDGEAAAVLSGFEIYNAANGGEPVDLFLPLGDNAYTAGTDDQWQGAFFEIYPQILKSAFVVPTIGNHEMGYGKLDLCAFVPNLPCGIRFLTTGGVSDSADPGSYDGDADLIPDGTGMPYLDIFTLPSAGESGGVPSGTEQYYSVDYGNVHVVSLDSQLSARDDTQRAAMKQWLMADLSQNNRDWTIVIFHHPPYTKGANHDSDDTEDNAIDRPIWDMRNEFTPVFEAYGVDVVFSGHSHSYERSYYLRGHTGTSDTFDPELHAELNNADEPALGYGDDTYEQLSPTSGGLDDRVVYSVAGSSGKADDGGGATTTDEEWLQHAAHVPQPANSECSGNGFDGCRRGLGLKGSMVIDASSDTLSAKFVDINGDVLDHFTIRR